MPNEEIVGPSTPDFNVSLNLDAPLNQSTGSPSLEPDPPSSNEVFVEVQQRPDGGGIQSLRKKTRYPPAARKPDLEGRVFVQFMVDENGQVTNPRVVRGHKVLKSGSAPHRPAPGLYPWQAMIAAREGADGHACHLCA